MDFLYSISDKFLRSYEAIPESKKEHAVKQYLKGFSVSDTSEELLPDFPPGLQWMNTTKPISLLYDLRGKLVILDFFTYCCINCMHVLPILKKLEDEFSVKDGLVIIGVHSAKFTNEKDYANIESAVHRYGITHPVINDSENYVWDSFCITCWPTLLVINPVGKPILILQGEGHAELLNLFVRSALNVFKEVGCLNNEPLLELTATEESVCYGPLLFPGKVEVFSEDSENMMVAVSDTGHHRVIIMEQNGNVKHIVGGLQRGLKDGDFDNARFFCPQGLAFRSKECLYVADTENHAIREINFDERTVKTVAGNGKQGTDKSGGKFWKDQTISSPWDLCFDKNFDVLYIAMAGLHQIWALFLDDGVLWKSKEYKKGTCIAIAGTGKEENRNNCYPRSASFAQPSGLAYCPLSESLFIADSESSSIRKLSLSDGKISAVVGGTPDPCNLFAFGDVDGKGHDAKLQHPLGVACCGKNVYVADSYNHKIKVIDTSLPKCSCTTIKIDAKLNEPGGLCMIKEDTLLVADTNNHCVKFFSVHTGQVSLFPIIIPPNIFREVVTAEKHVSVNCKGGTIHVELIVNMPADAKIAENTSPWSVELPGTEWSIVDKLYASNVDLATRYSINVPACEIGVDHRICFRRNFYFCASGKCTLNKLLLLISVSFSELASNNVYPILCHSI